jgi:hypothetical protein
LPWVETKREGLIEETNVLAADTDQFHRFLRVRSRILYQQV